jgi:branched-chain amino acid transport system substrate-binding protein
MVEQDGVAAVFGPTQAGQKAAVSEYIKDAGVPLIFYNGSPSGLFLSNEWLVGAGGANAQMPSVMADYSYNELGYRNVHTLTMDNVGFRSFTDYFAESFKALGGSVASDQYAPLPCADWAPYFSTMKDADAIMAWSTGSDAIAMWTAWHEMGIGGRMPVTAVLHAAFTDYFILNALSHSSPATAEAVLGTIAPTMYVYDVQTPENIAFAEAWTEEFGAIPQTNLPGLCYQAYLLFHTAAEAIGGDTDPGKLIKAIFAADINGPAGHLFFGDSHAAIKDVYVVKTVRLADGSYNYETVKEYKDVPPDGLAP